MEHRRRYGVRRVSAELKAAGLGKALPGNETANISIKEEWQKPYVKEARNIVFKLVDYIRAPTT